jgi:predicted transcriptional regulator
MRADLQRGRIVLIYSRTERKELAKSLDVDRRSWYEILTQDLNMRRTLFFFCQ